ncbi:MAG TPA: hypothetical protein VFE46_09825 [Pirellulales bacterium]|jgi:hypothetical protein|nr:hypothetical protein [Pirellulales bacterium]
MRRSVILFFAILVCVLSGKVLPAARADFDVSPRVEGGAIVTYGYDDEAPPADALTPIPPRVFEFDMDDPGPNITSDPGFHALAVGSGFTPSGLPNGSWLSFDVLSNLQYWNGSSFVAADPGNTLFLQLGGSFVSVTSATGTQPGFLIGQVGGTFTPPDTFSAGDEGLHVHLQSSIVFGPMDTGLPNPAGIYMFEMDLKLLNSDGVTPYAGISNSLPFWVIYDPDLADPNDPVDAAVAYQTAAVPEPSGCMLAGFAGLMLAGTAVGRRHHVNLQSS